MTRKPLTGPTLFDLVPNAPRLCSDCGGTILAPTIGGVPRGTCHCPFNLVKGSVAERTTDWTVERVKVVKSDPRECCKQVIAQYESIDGAEIAKARHAAGTASPVALFCPECKSCVTFIDGKWQREGEA